MGFFGDDLFERQLWRDLDPEQDLFESAVEPWLAIQIHDSDFATVRYAPRRSGSGVAYLGITPRVYFDDDKASQPTDAERGSDDADVFAEINARQFLEALGLPVPDDLKA